MAYQDGFSEPHSFCMQLFISFVDHCIQQEKYAELERLGFSRDIISEYENMSATARAHLSKSQIRCFDFMVYSETLKEVIVQAKSEAEVKKLMTECIQRGAPYEMMKRLYDMPLRKFKKYRKLFAMVSEGARVTDDPDLIDTIIQSWEAHGSGFEADTMITLCDELAVSMRILWSVLEKSVPREWVAGESQGHTGSLTESVFAHV